MIIVEGIDGAGKTTYIKNAYPGYTCLKQNLSTKEWKTALRKTELRKGAERINPLIHAEGVRLCFELHAKFIEAATLIEESGVKVVLDRSWPSTVVYQMNTTMLYPDFVLNCLGGWKDRHMNPSMWDIRAFMLSRMHKDKVILIDTLPQKCQYRISDRGEKVPDLWNLEYSRDKYLTLAKALNWKIVRGSL